MKNFIYILILASLTGISCSNDFIEIKPESTVDVDELYDTEKDFQDALIGCYRQLQIQYEDFWIYGDLRSDDSQQEIFSNISLLTVDNFTLTSQSNLLNDTWRNYYIVINRTNKILHEIESINPADLPNKDRYTGEARFLRALAYFDLVRIFGDLPMITTVITQEEAYNATRVPVSDIYAEVIIPDLLEAEKGLPDQISGAELGRASRGAAISLLAKVYLTTKDFIKAESTLQKVTTMGYALLDNFSDLFDYTLEEHHSEYIFDIEFEEGINLGSSFTNNFLPISIPMADYYNIRGSLGERNSPTDELFEAFDQEPNDLRRDITVGIKGGFMKDDGEIVPLLPNTSQSYTMKYITPVASEDDSRANWKVIRYADVLLMYAEALNENGKTEMALDYLNQVRNRAGLNSYSGLTQSDAREKIYFERRLELAFEGHRWFDLIRTGRALDLLEAQGMREHMTVFPLPLIQIQLINDRTIFPQNPGYD